MGCRGLWLKNTRGVSFAYIDFCWELSFLRVRKGFGRFFGDDPIK